MNVFRLRDQLVGQYSHYVKSFIQIRDQRIGEPRVWIDDLIQVEPR